jgi:RES domain-containing protein
VHSSLLPTTQYYEQVAFRYNNYDTPFWVNENTQPGRWHARGDGPTQYLSLSPEGAWAELARAQDLYSDEDLALSRMPIWAALVSQRQIVDYSTFEGAEAAGFSPDSLVDDDYSRCQEEARRLRTEAYAGVVAPSAALPGVLNLTLFGPRLRSSWGLPPDLRASIPACVVAIGSPAPGLAPRVRHVGESHVGYTDYEAGRLSDDQRPGLESNGESTDATDAPTQDEGDE